MSRIPRKPKRSFSAGETNDCRSNLRIADPSAEEPYSKRHKISRKIWIPIEGSQGYCYYTRMLIGHGGYRIKALEDAAGGRVSILVRDGKGSNKRTGKKSHILLEGEPSCVDKAESLINDLMQTPIISRKIMIPVGYDYFNLLIGPGGSKVQALESEAGGRVSIIIRSRKRRGVTRIFDVKDEPTHVSLEGERKCVDKAERLINDLWEMPYSKRRTLERVEEPDTKTHEKMPVITRKITLQVKHNSGYYANLLIGPYGSHVKSLEVKAGGRVKIQLRGKGANNGQDTHLVDEPLHVLLKGDYSCVNEAENLINDLLYDPNDREIMADNVNVSNVSDSDTMLLSGSGEERIAQRGTDLIEAEERGTKRCKVSRKIIIPTGYDYGGLLLGPGGSRVKAMETETGGQVKITVRTGKDENDWHCINHISCGRPHVLLEGEHSCVDKVERLINDLWNFQIVSRKIMMPAGRNYARLIIGQDGSKIKSLQAEAGGRVTIKILDGKSKYDAKDFVPHFLLEGESSCVDKAEILINKLLHGGDRKTTRNIMIPVERNPGYDYAKLLLGTGGSTIKELVAKAGGKLIIKLRGKGANNGRDSYLSDKPLHVLLQGDPLCIEKAEFLIDNLLQIPERERADAERNRHPNDQNIMPRHQIETGRLSARGEKTVRRRSDQIDDEPDKWNRTEDEIIWRKMMIPAGFDPRWLIGTGGSRMREIKDKTDGRVCIRLHGRGTTSTRDDKDEAPYVLLQGKSSSVDKAEKLINEIWKIPRITRKIRIPIERNPEYDYIELLIGPGGSRHKYLIDKVGGQIKIKLRGKGATTKSNLSDEPLHALLEGELPCVDKAESLINDLLQIPKKETKCAENTRNVDEVNNLNSNDDSTRSLMIDCDEKPDTKKYEKLSRVSRKMMIPVDPNSGNNYALLVGLIGSRIKALETEAGGQVKIEVGGEGMCDKLHCKDEPLYVLLDGECACVDKAESLINDMLQILERADVEKKGKLTEPNAANANDTRSIIDRFHAIGKAIGMKFKSDEDICNKITTYEMMLFGKIKNGTIKERLSNLEREIG